MKTCYDCEKPCNIEDLELVSIGISPDELYEVYQEYSKKGIIIDFDLNSFKYKLVCKECIK